MTAAARVPVHGRFRGLRLSVNARAVLSVLLGYVNEFGGCYPSRRLIAEEIGKSVDTVDRALRELVKAGVVRVQPQLVKGAKARLANNYLIPLAALNAGSVSADPPDPEVAARVRLGGRKGAATWPHGCGTNTSNDHNQRTHTRAVCPDPPPTPAPPAVPIDFVSVRTDDCATCARRAALNDHGVCVRCAREEVDDPIPAPPAVHQCAMASNVDEGDRWRLVCECGAVAMLSKVEGAVQSPWATDDDDDEQEPAPHVCAKCGAGAPRWIGRCAHCKAWNSLRPVEVDGADLEAWRAARAQETAASVDATRGLRWGPPKGMGNE